MKAIKSDTINGIGTVLILSDDLPGFFDAIECEGKTYHIIPSNGYGRRAVAVREERNFTGKTITFTWKGKLVTA